MDGGMNLLKLFQSIEKMKKIIGNDCVVSFSTGAFSSLQIKTEWFSNERMYTFQKLYTDIALILTDDFDVLLDIYCLSAKKEYEKAREKDSYGKSYSRSD
jgi:hypothetical protein